VTRPDPFAKARAFLDAGPNRAAIVAASVAAALVLVTTGAVGAMVHGAGNRLAHPEDTAALAKVAVADDAEVAYCTPAFKEVLQRVINACGLVGTEQRRGCQPADVKTFASISDDDFNKLFTPLKERGAVLLFEEGSDVLDDGATKLLDARWEDRKGARYFFIVARASKDGTKDGNRALSHKRANSVMLHLKEATQDPDLDKQVGMLWLGSEFAQFDKGYCDWPSSRADKRCTPEAINRSAFVSWVDCRL
jgi:outer membrane protein OmpA-like peptidoglycan-associated protein